MSLDKEIWPPRPTHQAIDAPVTSKPIFHLSRAAAWGLGFVLCRFVWFIVLMFLLGINEGSGPTEPAWLDTVSHYSNLEEPIVRTVQAWLLPSDSAPEPSIMVVTTLYLLDTFVFGFIGAVFVEAVRYFGRAKHYAVPR